MKKIRLSPNKINPEIKIGLMIKDKFTPWSTDRFIKIFADVEKSPAKTIKNHELIISFQKKIEFLV